MIKEDPYASMEKDQLISMIHFLVKREDERAQENQELKDMVKELYPQTGREDPVEPDEVHRQNDQSGG